MVNDDLRLTVARLREALRTVVVAKCTQVLQPTSPEVDVEALERKRLIAMIAEQVAGYSDVWGEKYEGVKYLTAELVILPHPILFDLRDALSRLEAAIQEESVKHW